MDINANWQVVEPWVSVILAAVSAVVTICITVKARLKKWNISFLEHYDANDMAEKVAQKLSYKTMNIDVTAITEKRMDKIEQRLHKQTKEMQEQVAAYKHILAQIGAAVSHFKSLSDDERQALQDAVRALDSDYTPPEPEQVVTVRLEPIATQEPTETDEGEGIINIGGLGK